MTNYKMKFVKSAAALALGASVITSAVVAGDLSASAKTTYKLSNGKLVNAKTKKAIKGYKVYKSVLYKDGKKYTGTYKAKYYKSGKLFTGKTSKGVYYKAGKKFTGTTSYGYYYKNGVRYTGKTTSGIYYKNGKKFNGTTTAGYYYINGKRAEGIVVVKGVDVLYKNGKVVADKTAPVITIDGQKDGDKIELKNGADFATPKASVKDNVDSKVKVVTEIKDQDGKVVDAIDTKVAGTYTITYAAKDASGNASAATITVEVGEADLTVESVKAVNKNTLTVNFNKEVEAVKDIEVVNSSTSSKQFVKSIKLSDDKKSAEVVLYDALTTKTTYNVTAKVGEEVATSTLDFVVGEAKTIELANQTVKTGNKLAYKVLDENGLDITADTTVNVETDKTDFFGSDLTVANGATGSAFLKLTVLKDGKVIAESPKVTVTATSSEFKDFGTNWTLASSANATLDYKANDYKQDSTVNLEGSDEYLNFTYQDQFGENVELTSDYTVKYTSLDPSVAIVDTQTGKVTPRKEGKVLVRATVLKDDKEVATKTVEVTVAAKSVLSDIKLDKTSVTLNADNATPEEVKVSGLDQFGGNVALVGEKSTTSSDEKVVTAAFDENDSILKLTPKAAGSATVEVKVGNFTKTISVKVDKVGAIVDYSLEGFVNELKTKDDTLTEADDLTMTVSVKGIDANGVKEANAQTAKFIVLDKDGNEVNGYKSTETASTSKEISGLAVGNYTLKVQVGTMTVATKEFSVTDNGIAPIYTLKSNKFTLTSEEDVKKAIIAELTNQFDFGTQTVKINKVTYTSNNSSVLSNDAEVGENGVATIYVDSVDVTVTDSSNALKAGDFSLNLNGQPFVVTVNVPAASDVAAE
ncbi:immunoglobulin-like domain-containing protein [uncultured Rummeliibacillus sp.]|uniref:immunoglobulin-like domain-containing protein n=1 Tax=uncultured Rummeliibacillus sp. TaxID=762292 RepID=UPI002630503B|nr:immunoglobulin-like domain-containing protein [uncultured Rummeliibacillus sp.]